MAPVDSSTSFYLAPLEKCLVEGHPLISWKTAYDAFADLDLALNSPNLKSFLLDDLSIAQLACGFDPIQPGTPQSKADFESRTAAINIVASENGQYDIEQIKKDVVWLSQEAKVDEVTALRIVVLEWQGRAAARILRGYTEEETISVQKALKSADLSASIFSPYCAPNGMDTVGVTFLSDDNRLGRLLHILLSEREHALAVGFLLLASSLEYPLEPQNRTYGARKNKRFRSIPWLEIASRKLEEAYAPRKEHPTILAIQALEKRIRSLEIGSGWSSPVNRLSELETAFRTTQVAEMMRILEILFVRISLGERLVPSRAVHSWFEFTEKYASFGLLQMPSIDEQHSTGRFQALICLVSLHILRLPYAIDYMNAPPSPNLTEISILNSNWRAAMTKMFQEDDQQSSPPLALAKFAWSIMLRSADGVLQSEKAMMEDDAYDQSATSPQLTRDGSLEKASSNDDIAAEMARKAIAQSKLFEVIRQLALMLPHLFDLSWEWYPQLHARIALLELLRPGVEFTQYNEDLVQAFLSTVQCGSKFIASQASDTAFPELSAQIITMVENDDILTLGFLRQAEYRYPCEMAPYLRICHSLTPAYNAALADDQVRLPLPETSESFTHTLPSTFVGFDSSSEREDPNVIRLTEDLPLFVPTQTAYNYTFSPEQQRSLIQMDEGQSEMRIPRGTLGRLISDSKPPTVMWTHRYSPLKYISLLLSTATPGSPFRPVDSNPPDKEAQTDNINLISRMCYRVPSCALKFLEEASDDLGRNEDIITVVAAIFESELSSSLRQRDDEWFDLLTSCLRFFSTVMKCMPNRIWPILARSDLLGIDGRGSNIASIATVSNASSGRQEFLHECVSLLDALITDVLSNALLRNGQTANPVNRFGKAPETSAGTSTKSMEMILLTLSQQSMILLQNSISDLQTLKVETSTNIIRSFTRVLDCVYGVGIREKPQGKLTDQLAPVGEFIIKELLGSSHNVLTGPLLTLNPHLRPSFGVLVRSSLPHSHQARIRATFALLTTLLHVSASLDTRSSPLEEHLFDILPLLIRLYASEESHRKPILILMSAMVANVAVSGNESTSFLGRVALETGRNFLNLLQESRRSLNDIDLGNRTWEFLANVINGKQQSLAAIIIMGNAPKSTLRRKNAGSTEEPSQKSILAVALDEVSKSSVLSRPHTAATLEFVNAAQNYWPWVTNSIRKHPTFLTQATEFLGNLRETITMAQPAQIQHLYTASLILNILSVYLHNMRQLGDLSFIKILGPKLSYFRDYGIYVPSYNTSLHANLKKNFEKKFPGCSLLNFKRVLNHSDSATNQFYDLSFAGEVLAFSSAWKQGFAREFSLANANLSLVHTQVKIMASWQFFAMELSMNFARERPIQKLMARTALKCMQANSETKAFEPFLEGLLEGRTASAFALSQRLVSVKYDGLDMRRLLSATWDATTMSKVDFDSALVAPGTVYYRSLLEMLLLALQPHTYSEASPASAVETDEAESSQETSLALMESDGLQGDIIPCLCEIATEVVGKGFRCLATELHTNPDIVLPSDFGLLTSILQAILRVRNVQSIYPNILHHLCEQNVHRCALALFSWSNKLLGPDNDPIVGELCISFIRELCTIPQMAEYLATEGILNQLSTAPLLGYVRQRSTGFGPLDQPYRVHAIWARGILPLTLSILIAIGDSYAAEATAFLNIFPNQLTRITTAFGAKAPGNGDITLDDAIEVHTLALLAVALDSYRGSAAAAATSGGYIPELLGSWTTLREDLEGWVTGRAGSQRGRIVPRGERETGLARAKPGVVVTEAASRLEEMVLVELKGAVMCLGGSGGGSSG